MSIKVIEVRRMLDVLLKVDTLVMKLECDDIEYDIILRASCFRRPTNYCVDSDVCVNWNRRYRGFDIQVVMEIPDAETTTYESVVTLVEQLEVEVMWMDAIIDTSIDKGIDDAPSEQYEFPTLSEIVNFVNDITQNQIDNLNELRALGIIV